MTATQAELLAIAPEQLRWEWEVVKSSRVLSDEQKRTWLAFALCTDGVSDSPADQVKVAALAGLSVEHLRQVRGELARIGILVERPDPA